MKNGKRPFLKKIPLVAVPFFSSLFGGFRVYRGFTRLLVVSAVCRVMLEVLTSLDPFRRAHEGHCRSRLESSFGFDLSFRTRAKASGPPPQ
eukprot:2059624-Amphidinium_carterae.1